MLTLICADTAGCSTFLADGIASLGRNSLVVHAPLDAIVRLQDVTMNIDAAFVSLQDDNFDISLFFAFLRDEHPDVRRIAFANMDRSMSLENRFMPACTT